MWIETMTMIVCVSIIFIASIRARGFLWITSGVSHQFDSVCSEMLSAVTKSGDNAIIIKNYSMDFAHQQCYFRKITGFQLLALYVYMDSVQVVRL